MSLTLYWDGGKQVRQGNVGVLRIKRRQRFPGFRASYENGYENTYSQSRLALSTRNLLRKKTEIGGKFEFARKSQ